jgi:hypothetical protein
MLLFSICIWKNSSELLNMPYFLLHLRVPQANGKSKFLHQKLLESSSNPQLPLSETVVPISKVSGLEKPGKQQLPESH